MDKRGVADSWLIPSLAKLDLSDRGGRGHTEQEHRAGRKDSGLVLLFLSLNSLSRALGPHVGTGSGTKREEGNDATLSSMLHRAMGTQDQEWGLQGPLPP